MSYRTTWPSYSGGLPASLGRSGGPVAGEDGRGGEISTEYFDIKFFRVELGGECVVCVVDVGERWKGGVCESIQWERCVTLRVEWRVMSEGPVGGE